MVWRVPAGEEEDRERAVCDGCGNVVYSNPKIVVACVILDERGDRCLLGRRSIEPRAGYWGFPQGYMEHGETSREAAVREAKEEMSIDIDPAALRLRCVYNVPGSVRLVYEARVDFATISAAAEEQSLLPEGSTSSECSAIAFFERGDLPELCFPTVQWALDHCWSAAKDRIQQKTKVYDAQMDRWTEEEDETLFFSS